MTRILSFPEPLAREARRSGNPLGELVAMSHVDLDTVVTTVRCLREAGRGHLLDDFNARPTSPAAERTAEPRRGCSPISRT